MKRPKGWDELYLKAYKKEYSGKGYGSPERAMFEAGADAYEDWLMKHRVKMPSDFKPILIVIPKEEVE